jgi:hypothetical protein
MTNCTEAEVLSCLVHYTIWNHITMKCVIKQPGLHSQYGDQAIGWTIWGSNSSRDKIFLSPKLPDWLCSLPILTFTDSWRPFPQGYSGQGVRLIPEPHLLQRLRMNWATSPPTCYVLMACTGTPLLYLHRWQHILSECMPLHKPLTPLSLLQCFELITLSKYFLP